AGTLVPEPAALRRVDVNRDLGERAFDHEALEQTGAPAEAVAVRHQHRDQADAARVAEDRDQYLRWQQRDLAVGDLRIALGPEPGAQPIELPQRRVQPDRARLIRVVSEVAARAGEVAARMDADGRAAAGRLLAEALSRRAPARIERGPAFAEQALLFGRNGM